jgi:hypothetical protein
MLRRYCMQRYFQTVCPRDKLIRRAEQRLVDLGEDVRYICPGKKGSKCLTRLLTSLVLVRVHGQEDATFPKQCIHACRDSLQPLPVPATASADITAWGQEITPTFLEDGWWTEQMKMLISSHVCFGQTSLT